MSMPAQGDEGPLSQDELLALAAALVEHDALSDDDARGLAESIDHMDPAIRGVARSWLATGQMPDSPLFWGYTPHAVAEIERRPSKVFEMLHLLCGELAGAGVELLKKRRTEQAEES